jgi:hypothetical protein
MAIKIKRMTARHYTCGNYYITYISEIKLWSVGYTDGDENMHIYYFDKYRKARDYVLESEVGA